MKRLLLTSATVIALLLSTPAIGLGQDSWVGKTILVKKHRIKIGHTDPEGRQVYVGALDGIDYKVLGDQGGWLQVRDRRGAAGWFDKADALPLEHAVAYFTELIRQDPANSAAYHYRATAWQLKGELDIAIADFSEVIRLNPTAAAAYNNRGNTRQDKKEYDKAIADYNEAIRLEPHETWYYNRGNAWRRKKDYENAIRDYSQAIKIDAEYANAYNNLAWLLATCPEAKFRDGNLAIEVAQQSCELTNWKVFGYVDTLAAAYAEAGQFDQAMRFQKMALADADFVRRAGPVARQRLQLYEQKKAYRE